MFCRNYVFIEKNINVLKLFLNSKYYKVCKKETKININYVIMSLL